VIWANTAAESLFGAAPGPARLSARQSAPRSEAATVGSSASTAPMTSRSEGGPVRRFFAALGRFFGRGA
jgi:hypothetical protein